MYDWLLFAHILAAFALVANVVILSALVMGAPATRGFMVTAEALGGIGGLGTLVFGVWLALDSDSFGIFDGWVLAALVLWLLTMPLQEAVTRGLGGEPRGGGEAVVDLRRAALANWLRAGVVLALIVVMVDKPGV